MTHPLSDELRRLADQYAATDEFGYAKAFARSLLRAADALDDAEARACRLPGTIRRLHAERDSLKAQLEQMTGERDEHHRNSNGGQTK